MLTPGFKITRPQSDPSGSWIEHHVQRYDSIFEVSADNNSHQGELLEKHLNDRLLIIKAPPGAGKSTSIRFLYGWDLLHNPNRKLIISVPEEMIGEGFLRGIEEREDGILHEVLNFGKSFGCLKLDWDVHLNLCENYPDSKSDEIIKFLSQKRFPKGPIGRRVLVCTHTSLARALGRLTDAELASAIVNTNMVIDETHHLKISDVDGSDEIIANKLGQQIYRVLELNDLSTRVCLATATFHRGDKCSILTEKWSKAFSVYELPFDEYWKQLKYIKSFAFDFIVYREDLFLEFENVLKSHKVPTIIYCPREGSKVTNKTTGSKVTFVQRIKDIIAKVWPNANVVDLVDEDGRDNRKRQVTHRNDSRKIDIVLAVGLMDQGVNWKTAVQIIDLDPKNSWRILIQRFGRTIRDDPTKEHIHYYMFLPFNCDLDTQPSEVRRRSASEIFAHLIASLLLQEYIQPVCLPQAKEDEQNNNEGSQSHSGGSLFKSVVPDIKDQHAILAAVMSSLMGNGDSGNVLDTILAVLPEFGITEFQDQIAQEIYRLLISPNKLDGLDSSLFVDAGFDKIIMDRLNSFVSGTCGASTFAEFRKICGSVENSISFEGAKRFVSKIAYSPNINIKKLKDYHPIKHEGNYVVCMHPVPETVRMKNKEHWRGFIKTALRPSHLPPVPEKIYQEFTTYRDFFSLSAETQENTNKTQKPSTKQQTIEHLLSQFRSIFGKNPSEVMGDDSVKEKWNQYLIEHVNRLRKTRFSRYDDSAYIWAKTLGFEPSVEKLSEFQLTKAPQ